MKTLWFFMWVARPPFFLLARWLEAGGPFCYLLWKIVQPPRSEGFLSKVANFLIKGGKKDPPWLEEHFLGVLLVKSWVLTWLPW